MPPSSPSESSLTGQVLIAMPSLDDPEFSHSVIYLCAHGEEGAMGLIVNKPLPSPSFKQIVRQLNVSEGDPARVIALCKGGPVETARGFVLHSADYKREGTLTISDDIALSATTEVLRAIATGEGPTRSLMALGYAGWGEGQLDEEIKRNAWLSVPADAELLFSEDVTSKWTRALGKLGINPAMLSASAGHA